MTTYPAVQSIQVILSSEDASPAPTLTDFEVSLHGQLPQEYSEYYCRMLAMEVRLSNPAALIREMVSVHMDIGQPDAICSNPNLRARHLGTFSDYQQSGTVFAQPYVRISRPDLSRLSVQLRNAATGSRTLTPTIDGVIWESTTIVLELVPITYDLIAREQVGYKHSTF